MSDVKEGSDEPSAEVLAQFQITDQRYRTIRAICRYLLIAFCIWQAQVAVSALAGHETSLFVHFVLTALAKIEIGISFAIAGGSTLWALMERKLRHRAIERLHARIGQLEKQKDAKRSSSGLTTKGKTNPRDKES